VVIHDALLSLYRVQHSREGVIKELYKLGMGLYYLRRLVNGVEAPGAAALAFHNEMVFTEASSYIRYYDEIDSEETRGYIIRAFANIALCAPEHKRRIAASARTLRILQDEHYRALAPGLPWDAFLRGTHQQMSANRSELSRGNLSRDELAAVLDSCYEVFKPEEGADNPSVRWLWPYYEMEYNCGYVDLKTTLDRLEDLIGRAPYDQYDVSGLYGNVQLPIYYGRLMQANPALQREEKRVHFLNGAYRKMQQVLLQYPAEQFDDFFYYLIDLVVSDYFEMEGVPPYRELTTRIMQRFAGELYIRSRRTGDMMRCICAAIFAREPDFFDDIPFLAPLQGEEKKQALLAYAGDCGLYHDFGLIKMNIGRTMGSRNLFENEFQIYQLHTVSGYDDLRRRSSTADFADVALGHHSWYGGGGYPDTYVRTASPCRQMTDVAAVAAHMVERYDSDMDALVRGMLDGARGRFSPPVTAYLTDGVLCRQLEQLLQSDGRNYYRDVYRELLAGRKPAGTEKK
jgi:hypothetical protein